jgi:hypothetical protein
MFAIVGGQNRNHPYRNPWIRGSEGLFHCLPYSCI